MYNHVMENKVVTSELDVKPRTLSAKAHRPAYGSDGDYFSKPNVEEIVSVISEMIKE